MHYRFRDCAQSWSWTIGNPRGFQLGYSADSDIWRTRNEKLKPYHAYLYFLVDRFEELRYIHLPRAENQFANALATLASVIKIPTGMTVRPLLIEIRMDYHGTMIFISLCHMAFTLSLPLSRIGELLGS